MTPARDPRNARFELCFSPDATSIPLVRRFVLDFYAQVLRDAELASRLCMAAHELLENAVSYSTDGRPRLVIDVQHAEGAFDVVISTENRAGATDVEVLQRRLEALAAAPDPAAHYYALMRESARRKTGSGLGLGRVRAEADMELSCQVEEGTVRVYARARFADLRP